MKPIVLCVSLAFAASSFAQAPPARSASSLPVREVTVFKDGHAYVVRETALGADDKGQVVLEDLPVPVMGTFWPYATDGARLVSAKAGRDTVSADLPATDLPAIARANVGKAVVVMLHNRERVEGELLAVPVREPEPPKTDANGRRTVAPPPAQTLLLVKTSTGTRALPLGNVQEIEVHGEFQATVRESRERERLVLEVAGGGPAAKVGVMYVQRGLRWIPAYRIDVDGAGKAAVQFEGTLVNDLVDLEHATVHLVVGVPKFEFEGLVDPISLQQEIAQVEAAGRSHLEYRNVLSNSMRTQAAQYVEPAETEPANAALDGASTEDLYVFTLRDVTLKKGERLVLPIASFELAYRDVYRLDVPFAPPMEVRQNIQSDRAIELARLLSAPKARHVLRLRNGSDAPLTTAPVLVFAKGRVLAQARITYTSPGRETDVEINPAVDVRVESSEEETKRDPGPIQLGNESYGRVSLAGKIAILNTKPVPVTIEVTRRVLGLADDVGQNGTKRQLDLVQAWSGVSQPSWWGAWSWPYWWFAHNGFGEFRWTVELEAGKSTQLDASWHYFWR